MRHREASYEGGAAGVPTDAPCATWPDVSPLKASRIELVHSRTCGPERAPDRSNPWFSGTTGDRVQCLRIAVERNFRRCRLREKRNLMMGLSNRRWDVKHKLVEGTLLGAWLSSRSTLAAAWWSFAGRAFNVDDALR